MVTLRLLDPPPSPLMTFNLRNFRRTGYHELWRAISMVEVTETCDHATADEETILLEPGWATISHFGELPSEYVSQWDWGRTLICLTAGNPAARWLCILSITRFFDSQNCKGFVLRSLGCCMKCAILQASQREGNWYVIL